MLKKTLEQEILRIQGGDVANDKTADDKENINAKCAFADERICIKSTLVAAMARKA